MNPKEIKAWIAAHIAEACISAGIIASSDLTKLEAILVAAAPQAITAVIGWVRAHVLAKVVPAPVPAPVPPAK